MIFTLIVSVLNAAGWIGYYVFSGGINEPTETSAVRICTILGFIICSAVAGLVSFHCTHVFNSFLLNAGHNSLTTAMASAPLILMTTNKSMLKDPDCLSWGMILLIIVLYLIAYFFYFATCIWPTYSMGGGDGLRDLMFLGVKFVVIAGILCYVTSFPHYTVGQYAFAYGLITSIPMSIILAIRSKITD